MKVPYFDIRSHFLLWMIFSKVFSMYINADSQSAQPRPQGLLFDDFQNGGSTKIVEEKALGTRLAVRHVDYRGEKDWWQICPDYTLFSLPVFHKKTIAERKRAAGDGNPSILAIFFEESTAASRCRRVSIKCI